MGTGRVKTGNYFIQSLLWAHLGLLALKFKRPLLLNSGGYEELSQQIPKPLQKGICTAFICGYLSHFQPIEGAPVHSRIQLLLLLSQGCREFPCK